MNNKITERVRKTKGISIFALVLLLFMFGLSFLAVGNAQADICENLNVPASHLPPTDLCRIWTPGVSPAHQGPFVPCSCQEVNVPVDSCLINGVGNSVQCKKNDDCKKHDDCDDDCDDDDDDCKGKKADLSVEKSDSPDPVNPGDELTYEITVLNQGPEDAKYVTLYDILPKKNVELKSVSGCDGEYQVDDGVITCKLGEIDDDDSKAVKVVVIPAEKGLLVNTASVYSEKKDPNLANNVDIEVTKVGDIKNVSDLSVTKTDIQDPVELNKLVIYEITVKNSGPDMAKEVILTDDLPKDTTLDSVEGCEYSEENGVLTCQLGDIAVDEKGRTVYVKLKPDVPENDGTFTIVNKALVTYANDPSTSNNEDSEETTIGTAETSADLSVTKEDTQDPVELGNQINYVIKVTNNGPDTADSVILTDYLPDDTKLVSVKGCLDEDKENDPDDVTCKLDDLKVDESAVVSVVLEAEKEGTIVNKVHVESATSDLKPENNYAEQETTVEKSEEDDLPRIDLGSGSGNSNGAVTIPAILTNKKGGLGIAAASVKIKYDTNVLENPLTQIGPASSNANKGIAMNESTPGSLIISIFSVANNNIIGNGNLFYLSFHIKSDAQTGTETTLENTPSASDPFGKSVTVYGSDGLIKITDFMLGDCNGDDQVDIAEVQAAIDMFLGIIPVESCADADGDGELSISEVQTIIYNHLGIDLKQHMPSFTIDNLFIGGKLNKDVKEASESPVLEVGTDVVAIAGQTGFMVPLVLKNGGGYGIAAIGADVSFESSLLENPTVLIGPAGKEANKEVVSSTLGNGKLRFGVLSVKGTESIEDGTVVYVRFDISSDAQTGEALIRIASSASGLTGNDVPIYGEDGNINILQEGVSKDEGTVGSQLTLVSNNIGKKGAVTIGDAKCGILSWKNNQIDCKLKEALAPGSYKVSVKSSGGDSNDMGSFTVMSPKIESAKVAADKKGKQSIIVQGKYFGTSKGKLLLSYVDDSGTVTERNCKVSRKQWKMDPVTEDSEITCPLPKKLNPESITGITIQNHVGKDTVNMAN